MSGCVTAMDKEKAPKGLKIPPEGGSLDGLGHVLMRRFGFFLGGFFE